MNELQPISSAPKNGTKILAWSRRQGFQVVQWTKHPHNWNPNDMRTGWDSVGPRYYEDAFTHWMPLPEPPNE